MTSNSIYLHWFVKYRTKNSGGCSRLILTLGYRETSLYCPFLYLTIRTFRRNEKNKPEVVGFDERNEASKERSSRAVFAEFKSQKKLREKELGSKITVNKLRGRILERQHEKLFVSYLLPPLNNRVKFDFLAKTKTAEVASPVQRCKLPGRNLDKLEFLLTSVRNERHTDADAAASAGSVLRRQLSVQLTWDTSV